MTSINEIICALVAIGLACKYQLVASSMSQIVKGNLDSLKNANRIKLLYGITAIAAIITFIIYVAKCIRVTEGNALLDMEFRFLVGCLFLLLFLFCSYIKSMYELAGVIK